MYKQQRTVSKKIFIFTIIFAVLAALLIIGSWFFKKEKTPPAAVPVISEKNIPVSKRTVIDYDKIKKDSDADTALLMEKRKTKFGMGKGVDLIIKSDELFKVGDSTVPMQTIIDKIRLKSGEIIEKSIDGDADSLKKKVETFGIYVVQKNDNIWNIHFKFLKDYFDYRAISIAPTSDEPDKLGYSSGVGKLLKFSEHIVNIYNIKENRLDTDINLIQPLSKLVIYNMTQIFALLDSIEYDNVNHIQFDGETLWVSPER